MTFSIRHLLFVMLVVAFGVAALTNANLPLVAELFDVFTPLTIIILGYMAWVSVGEQRSFRIGFVTWGGIYFLATRWWHFAFYFATGQLLWLLHEPLKPNFRHLSGDPFQRAEVDWMNRFDTIAHSLFALLFGLIGGWVTVYYYRKRQRMLAKEH